jgi:hypothetical protein
MILFSPFVKRGIEGDFQDLLEVLNLPALKGAEGKPETVFDFLVSSLLGS